MATQFYNAAYKAMRDQIEFVKSADVETGFVQVGRTTLPAFRLEDKVFYLIESTFNQTDSQFYSMSGYEFGKWFNLQSVRE